MEIIIISGLIGAGIGALLMFIELTESRSNWVTFREWSNKHNSRKMTLEDFKFKK